MIIYDYIQAPPAPAVDFRQYSRRAKLPFRRVCPLLPLPFIINEGDGYNCNLCASDSPFYIPYKAGDQLGFRLNLPDEYNADPATIVAGWRDAAALDWYVQAELIDADGGAVLSSLINEFSDLYSVGYSDECGSVQDFTINTNLFPLGLTCFKIRLTYRIAGEPDAVYYTEPFKLLEHDECIETTQITGGPTICANATSVQFSNYLGTSNAVPILSYRLKATPVFTGCDIEETETDRGVIIRRKQIENYEVNAGVVPSYFAKIICGLIASGGQIDGETFVNFGGISKEADAGEAFVLSFTYSRTCELDLFKCD